MKTSIKLTMLFLVILVAFLNSAAGNNTDQSQNEKSTGFKCQNPQGLDNSLNDLQSKHMRNINHICVIEQTCSHFHDAYLRMPSDLSELVETGFIAFWPGNIFNGGPMKILDTPPDPSNPEQLGNVFYKRISDHEATLVYLDIDRKNSTQDSAVLKIAKMEINSPTASTFLDIPPDEDPYFIYGPQLMEMKEVDRARFAYKKMLSQSLSYIVADAVTRNDVVEPNFQDLLSNGAYYVSEQSLSKLRDMAEKENLKFGIGYYDATHSFYNAEYGGEEIISTCIATAFDVNMKKNLDYDAPIPESQPISVIDQDSILKIELPANLFIKTSDL
jgi:hypothetical protein